MNAFLTFSIGVTLTQLGQPTNLLAVVALGLLVRSVPEGIAFVAGLIAGSIMIALPVRETPAALALLIIAAIAGLAVAAARPLPRVAVAVLAFLGGTALALNAPPQALTIKLAIVEQFIIAAAALALLTAVALLRSMVTHPWHLIAVRVVASWIAASAILVLALRLAR